MPGGATVEREVATALGQGEFVHIELDETDFSTARRVVDAINVAAPGSAVALDGRSIQVRAPTDSSARVSFIGMLESLPVNPAQQAARVIVNSRTGSVVMNQSVSLQSCAVAHGNLTVTVRSEPLVSQPAPFSAGQTVVAGRGRVDIEQSPGSLINVPAGASLSEVVKALNAVGANPLDLVNILQAMKAVGALRADLEII